MGSNEIEYLYNLPSGHLGWARVSSGHVENVYVEEGCFGSLNPFRGLLQKVLERPIATWLYYDGRPEYRCIQCDTPPILTDVGDASELTGGEEDVYEEVKRKCVDGKYWERRWRCGSIWTRHDGQNTGRERGRGLGKW